MAIRKCKHERNIIALVNMYPQYNETVRNFTPAWMMQNVQTGERWKYVIAFEWTWFQRYFDAVQLGLVSPPPRSAYTNLFGGPEQFFTPFCEWGVPANTLQQELDVILGTVLRTLRVRVSNDKDLSLNDKYRLIHPSSLQRLRSYGPHTDKADFFSWLNSGDADLKLDEDTHRPFSLDYTVSVDKHLFTDYTLPQRRLQQVEGEIALTLVNGVLCAHFHFTDILGKKVKRVVKNPKPNKRKLTGYCFIKEKLSKYK